MSKRLGIFFVFLFVLLLITYFTLVYIGNASPPVISEGERSKPIPPISDYFYSKKNYGINNVFLSGTPFQRGRMIGQVFKKQIAEQEEFMFKKLDELIPSKITQRLLFLFSSAWFYDIEDHFKEEWLHEMYGVSFYSPQQRVFGHTTYTRQVAYHGIHEMGQMMVDRALVDGFGCTQVAEVDSQKNWLIGRNFDFSLGSIFDEKKLLKWVFPDKGYPYVSIIFPGMVGAVTGVNIHGVYVALNAAGSDDFRRVGVPTTLITLEALQYAKTASEAVEIIKNMQSFISEIFVVAGPGENLYVIEKSPEKMTVEEVKSSNVVTNHFSNSLWSGDKTNKKRIQELTTFDRYARAQELLYKEHKVLDPLFMLNILRDKVIAGKIRFGHRSAIDGFVATHSALYDMKNFILYVSEGPSLVGQFFGYDVKKSFSERRPVMVTPLEADKSLNKRQYYKVKTDLKALSRVGKMEDCHKIKNVLDNSKNLLSDHYQYSFAKSVYLLKCKNDKAGAKTYLRKSLSQKPAYMREVNIIKERLGQ